MPPWLVITVSALYLALLFAIAWRGDEVPRDRPLFPRGAISSAILYALTLGVHITAWSFYGGVGRAATNGFDYLATSIGAFLFLILGQGALRRVIAISKAHNITSVSDFLSARYGKRRPIAAFITLASFVGVLPYIALQLKAVAFSFDILTGAGQAAPKAAALFGATDFWAALALAAFTMAFGVRHIHASERHRGFVLAVAFDSLVKLAAFVIVALLIVYGAFDSFGDLFGHAGNDPQFAPVLNLDLSRPDWWSKIVVAVLSFLCMPQFIHVAVVENDDPASVRPAAALYPAYALIFSAFMTPVAIAGLVTFGGRADPDTFVIALPIAVGAPSMSLLAFIGGLSAAAGMVMVSTAALSTMLCNDVVLPVLLRPRATQKSSDLSALLLTIRRALVAAVILCAFAMRRSIDDSASLGEMGVLSFVAAAQLVPAFFGGLYWRKARAAGAVAGMALGLAVWFYALLLPTMAGALGLSHEFLDDGPWKIAWLRPHGLFGTGFLDPVTHATLWSLALNVGSFVVLSLARGATQADRENALALEPLAEAGGAVGRADTVGDLAAIAAQFIGAEHAEAAFGHYAKTRARRSNGSFDLTTRADERAVRFAENLIAGAIGAASARVVMAGALRGRRLSGGSPRAMIADASAALHEKHALLRAITENVQQGICALDAQLRLSAWNNRFSELLDLPSDFLKVGLPLSEIVAFNKTRGEYRDDQLERLFVNRDLARETWPYVYERTRPDGTVLEVTFNRMDVGGYVATYADVTERHRAAQALRAANETLERRVAERTTALEIAKTEAEKANAGKTRFLAAASQICCSL